MLRKCLRCNILFKLDERVHCLYCDSLLLIVNPDDEVDSEDISGRLDEKVLLGDIVRHRSIRRPDLKYNIISNYFRIRALPFLYSVCRQEMVLDERFRRFWVQPLTMAYFITFMPWLIINFFDSILVHLFYRGYCEDCNCRYIKLGGTAKHDPGKCEYNKEYFQIIFSILNGSIIKNEGQFRKLAEGKLRQGKKCAYFDLCTSKRRYQSTIDVTCIWFSSALIVTGLVWVSFPLTKMIVKFIIYYL